MRCLIIIHMISRDRYWAEYVRRKIEEESSENKVKIITFDQIVPEVIEKNYRPNSILTYTLRDELSVLWITALKVITRAKIVVYENEGLMNYDDLAFIRKRIGIASRSKLLVDQYYYWGKKPATVSAKLLLEKGFINDTNIVTYCGYINYEMESKDIIPVLSKKERELLERVRIHCHDEKMILVLTGFPLIDLSDEEFLSDGEIITNDMAKLHIYAESERKKMWIYREKYVAMVKKLAKIYPNIPFVIKPHPAENERPRCKEYYQEVFKDIPNVMVLNEAILVGLLLDNARLLIHYGSTTALECYIRSIPTLVYKDESYQGNSDLTESTIEIRGEINELKLEDISFRRFEENDRFIYDLFNYKLGKEYKPSKDLIVALKDQKNRYSINKKDLLAYISKKNLIRYLVRKSLGCIKKGKIKEAIRITTALPKVI